jgi:hypothetical protein
MCAKKFNLATKLTHYGSVIMVFRRNGKIFVEKANAATSWLDHANIH